MNYLQTNTAFQTLLFSLKEGSLLYAETFTNYLIIIQNEITLEKYAVIPVQISENDRITTLAISTNDDNPTNGCIYVTNGGRYNFIIYGQNSDSNLDPQNSEVVVGEIKRGYIQFETVVNYYNQPNIVIPSDIEYNG
jgi:hypothetical protein